MLNLQNEHKPAQRVSPMSMIPLGERLHRWRETNRLSLTALAMLLGVSKISVWQWERRGRRPQPRTRTIIEDLIARPYPLGGATEKLPVPEAPLGKIVQLNTEIHEAKARIAALAGVSSSDVNIIISFS